MDEFGLFIMKWVAGIVLSLLFILVGYIISPDDFTTVLGIIIATGIFAIAYNQWGEKHVVN